MSAPTIDPAPGGHPAGRSIGNRNANCLARALGGAGLGNGGVTPPQFQPRWHIVAARPERPKFAREGFAALFRALLAQGHMDEDVHTLLAVLLDRSNNQTKSVVASVRSLAKQLGWSSTKVKRARGRASDLGVLVWHNRCRPDHGIVANRYNVCYDYALTSSVGWRDATANKKLGYPDAHLHPDEQRRRRRELDRLAARNKHAREERTRIVDWIANSATLHDTWTDLVTAIEHQFPTMAPSLHNYAMDEANKCWDRIQACRFGEQLAGLDLSMETRYEQIAIRYHNRPELAQAARTVLDTVMRH